MISIDDKKYKSKRREIEKFLKDKSQFEKIDSSLIEELINQIWIADLAKEEMQKGLMVNVAKDGVWMQPNPAIKILSNASKNIGVLSSKLGLTVQERNKLKQDNQEPEESDGFDD